MRTIRIATVAVAALTTLLFAQMGQAQEKGTRQPGRAVVAIDLPYIVQNWDWLKQQKEQMQNDVKREGENFKNRQTQLQKEMESLTNLKPDSPDYKKREANITQGRADLQVQMALKEKEFKERDAKVMYDAVQRIDGVVQQFCEENGIGMVIQYSKVDMDPSKPATVMARINSPVFYQDNKDISPEILKVLNKGAAPTADRRNAPAAPRAR